jgi:hypothetical protein
MAKTKKPVFCYNPSNGAEETQNKADAGIRFDQKTSGSALKKIGARSTG